MRTISLPTTALLTFFVWAVTMTITPYHASAQVTEAVLLQRLQEAQQKGVKLSSDDIQNIITRFKNRKERLRQMEKESEVNLGEDGEVRSAPLDVHNPISRILGKDGISFPKPEEVVLKPAPTSRPQSFATPTPAPLWSPLPYTAPTKCEENTIRREVVYKDADDSILMRDKLFLPEDFVPLDPEEVFGAKVTLEPYGPSLESTTLQTMELYKVPCLPYRVRRTQHAEYHLYGTHALRTYTSTPTGKEKLHPFIQQKIHPGSAPRR
jgi:hypothetical protein